MARSELAKLFVTIGLDDREFHRKFKALGSVMRSGMIVGTAVAAGIVAATKSWANAGEEIANLSKQTGMATETLSRLKYAAEQSDVSISNLQTATSQLARVMSDAQTGGRSAQDALAGVGLSAADLFALKPDQRFLAVAEAIAEMVDPTQRQAAAMELFGQSGTNLLPMLADGKNALRAMMQEADRLGLVFDQKAAASAAKFNEELKRLKSSFEGLRNEIGSAFGPALSDAMANVTEMISQAREGESSGIMGGALGATGLAITKFAPGWWKALGLPLAVGGSIFGQEAYNKAANARLQRGEAALTSAVGAGDLKAQLEARRKLLAIDISLGQMSQDALAYEEAEIKALQDTISEQVDRNAALALEQAALKKVADEQQAWANTMQQALALQQALNAELDINNRMTAQSMGGRAGTYGLHPWAEIGPNWAPGRNMGAEPDPGWFYGWSPGVGDFTAQVPEGGLPNDELGSGGQSQTIVINVDGREIARVADRYLGAEVAARQHMGG